VTDARNVAGSLLQVLAGINYDALAEARIGYRNYSGSKLGVEGTVRRERSEPGLRLRPVRAPVLNGADRIVHYPAVNPVGGITFRASSTVYGSYGKSFGKARNSGLSPER
jgi:hypothetical protein